MPEMTANWPLKGDYGQVVIGERFTVDDQTAESLASRGLASYYYPPIRYETKVAPPQETPRREPPTHEQLRELVKPKGGRR